jgi:hypothetical protein
MKIESDELSRQTDFKLISLLEKIIHHKGTSRIGKAYAL